MLVTPGTHTGEVWNHHGEDGCFAGLIDPDIIKHEIERAVPCMGTGRQHVVPSCPRLHGSAMNTSDRPRNLLLYEVAASDAWPLMGVKDFDEFNSRLLSGDPVVTPRLTDVPGAHAAAAGQAAGIDLRNPVRGEEILLHPRGMNLTEAPAHLRGRLDPTASAGETTQNNDKKAQRGKP